MSTNKESMRELINYPMNNQNGQYVVTPMVVHIWLFFLRYTHLRVCILNILLSLGCPTFFSRPFDFMFWSGVKELLILQYVIFLENTYC